MARLSNRDVDALVEAQYEDALGEEEPWALESHAYRQLLAKLATTETALEADADFIAHARQDIPALLAALEAKDGEVERLRVAWVRSFAMLRATYPHPDHVPLVVERVIDMMDAALAPSTPRGEDHAG